MTTAGRADSKIPHNGGFLEGNSEASGREHTWLLAFKLIPLATIVFSFLFYSPNVNMLTNPERLE